jgi:hypothetical protein
MDRSSQSYRNRLLQLLGSADFDRLRPHLKPVALEYRQSLYEANENINFVYFPIEGCRFSGKHNGERLSH